MKPTVEPVALVQREPNKYIIIKTQPQAELPFEAVCIMLDENIIIWCSFSIKIQIHLYKQNSGLRSC